MVHLEFGQDRLTQPHPLNAFELAQGAIKGAFVLFSTTLLGLVGFVLQNHFLLSPWLAWYNHASLYAASSFPTPSSESSKAGLSLEAGFSPCFSGCPR
jgi:hypothetical protein